MGKSVSTNEYKVVFQKGFLRGEEDPLDGSVECGYGTNYCLQVSLDNLAELFYRVKDSKIVACDIENTDVARILLQDGSPPAQNVTYVESEGEYYLAINHGMFVSYLTSSPPVLAPSLAWLSQYYGEGYTIPYSSWTYHDVQDQEYAIWFPNSELEPVCAMNHGINYGFSDITLESLPSGYLVYSVSAVDGWYGDAAIFVTISREVAWTGADNPFDPSATLWVGANVIIVSYLATLYYSSAGEAGSEVCNFELELADNQILNIPLYDVETLGGPVIIHTNPRLKATEWWPYAKNSPPVPIWDSTTGLKI